MINSKNKIDFFCLSAKLRTCLLVTLASATSFLPCAQARPPELRPNAREGCRQEMAGAYLKIYDEREKNRTLMIHVKDTIKELNATLKDAKAAQAKAIKEAEESTFTANKAAARQVANSRVETIESQLVEYNTMLKDATAATPDLITREKALRADLEKVFVFERMNDLKDGGYPIHLNYRSGCPKYRHLCPLPEAERKALLAIKIDGGTPESCRRYAAIKPAPQ